MDVEVQEQILKGMQMLHERLLRVEAYMLKLEAQGEANDKNKRKIKKAIKEHRQVPVQ